MTNLTDDMAGAVVSDAGNNQDTFVAAVVCTNCNTLSTVVLRKGSRINYAHTPMPMYLPPGCESMLDACYIICGNCGAR
jgi:hypothetical protein